MLSASLFDAGSTSIHPSSLSKMKGIYFGIVAEKLFVSTHTVLLLLSGGMFVAAAAAVHCPLNK